MWKWNLFCCAACSLPGSSSLSLGRPVLLCVLGWAGRASLSLSLSRMQHWHVVWLLSWMRVSTCWGCRTEERSWSPHNGFILSPYQELVGVNIHCPCFLDHLLCGSVSPSFPIRCLGLSVLLSPPLTTSMRGALASISCAQGKVDVLGWAFCLQKST
jgi:hypothetical protein